MMSFIQLLIRSRLKGWCAQLNKFNLFECTNSKDLLCIWITLIFSNILLKLGNHRISIQDQQVNGLLKTCMVSIEVFVFVIIWIIKTMYYYGHLKLFPIFPAKTMQSCTFLSANLSKTYVDPSKRLIEKDLVLSR